MAHSSHSVINRSDDGNFHIDFFRFTDDVYIFKALLNADVKDLQPHRYRCISVEKTKICKNNLLQFSHKSIRPRTFDIGTSLH